MNNQQQIIATIRLICWIDTKLSHNHNGLHGYVDFDVLWFDRIKTYDVTFCFRVLLKNFANVASARYAVIHIILKSKLKKVPSDSYVTTATAACL